MSTANTDTSSIPARLTILAAAILVEAHDAWLRADPLTTAGWGVGQPAGAKVLLLALPDWLLAGVSKADWKAMRMAGLIKMTRVDMLSALRGWDWTRPELSASRLAAAARASAAMTGSEWEVAIELE